MLRFTNKSKALIATSVFGLTMSAYALFSGSISAPLSGPNADGTNVSVPALYVDFTVTRSTPDPNNSKIANGDYSLSFPDMTNAVWENSTGTTDSSILAAPADDFQNANDSTATIRLKLAPGVLDSGIKVRLTDAHSSVQMDTPAFDVSYN